MENKTKQLFYTRTISITNSYCYDNSTSLALVPTITITTTQLRPSIMSKAGLAADASNVLIHVRGKINKFEHQLKWLTHSCKWCHFLFMLMLYFGLQEMLDSPWNDRFRLPLSAQEALRYWSSGSCSSFCTTNHRKAHVRRSSCVMTRWHRRELHKQISLYHTVVMSYFRWLATTFWPRRTRFC